MLHLAGYVGEGGCSRDSTSREGSRVEAGAASMEELVDLGMGSGGRRRGPGSTRSSKSKGVEVRYPGEGPAKDFLGAVCQRPNLALGLGPGAA